MTLWRQLCIVIIILLAAVFAGTFIISMHSMHRFLITQMNSHAQDTSSSLGLSIGDNFAAKDMVTVGRIIDAIFDRGYYKKITVKDITGNVLYENIFQEEIENAPVWFRKIIDIPEVEAESMLLSGWHNIGSLYVTSHPGYAYFELWEICKDNFWWFLGCISILLFSSLIALHSLLRPLRYVVEQAKAIAAKEFLVQDKIPFTTEFKIVVETMNKMSVNLKEIFEKHVEFSNLMRERSYKEVVTGLGNRRYFQTQLDHMLSSSESSISGAIILVRLTEMGEYRNKWGYQLGDLLLKDVAAILTGLLNDFNIPVLSHFGNYEFAIIILNIDKSGASTISDKILKEINSLENHEFVKETVPINIGGVIFTHDNFTNNSLHKADDALRHSQTLGLNKICIEEIKEVKPAILVENWEDFLHQVIAEKKITFNYQPVFFYESNATILFHNEALLRLVSPSKEILTAGLFMPMVEKLKLGVELDKIVITSAFKKIVETKDGSQRNGINLSEASLKDPDFIRWLSENCGRARSKFSINRLNIEVSEKLARENLDSVKELFRCLKMYGIQVGLDHFGGGFSSFSYLKDLNVDYIKIDGSYTRGIEDEVDNQMIIRSFIEMGHSLGIVIIATAVETESEREMLMSLNVDGMQGYFIGQPA